MNPLFINSKRITVFFYCLINLSCVAATPESSGEIMKLKFPRRTKIICKIGTLAVCRTLLTLLAVASAADAVCVCVRASGIGAHGRDAIVVYHAESCKHRSAPYPPSYGSFNWPAVVENRSDEPLEAQKRLITERKTKSSGILSRHRRE